MKFLKTQDQFTGNVQALKFQASNETKDTFTFEQLKQLMKPKTTIKLELSDEKLAQITNQQNKHGAIVELDLSDGQIAQIIEQQNKPDTKIKLDLSDCNLGDENMEAVVDLIQGNKSLIELNLANNNITNSGAATLATHLEKNHYLEILCIEHNNITNPQVLSNNHLRALNAANNKITSLTKQLFDKSGNGYPVLSDAPEFEYDLKGNPITECSSELIEHSLIPLGAIIHLTRDYMTSVTYENYSPVTLVAISENT